MSVIEADRTESVRLRGQQSTEVPVEAGMNEIHVQVHHGKLRINHGAYTPDGGTWLEKPSGRESHYDLKEGREYDINVDIRESFGKVDRIFIVNPSLLKTAEFEIKVQPVKG